MNILLTSVGRRSYLVRYFQDALQGRGKVIGANSHAEAPGMRACDEAFVVPAACDPSYVDAIEALCRAHDVGLLCSCHDLDVFVLSQQRDRLTAAGVIPVLPSPEWGRVCLDKYLSGLKLQAAGCAVPWTGTTLEATEVALADGRVHFPLVIKARLGFGSLGLHRCRNLEELRLMHRSVRAELAASFLSRFHDLPEEEWVITQEVIDGPEYCLDVVHDLAGHYAAHFACRIHAMRAGESDRATTVDPSFLGDLPHRFSRLTGHPGLWGIDLMMHQGVPKIIDINPRFTGDYPFQHLAGANIPAALIAWAQGRPVKDEWLSPEYGVEGYKDLVPTLVKDPTMACQPTERNQWTVA